MLMDEPFSALDVQTREVLQEEVLRIRERTGCTILFVTHSIDEAVFLGDRIFLLTDLKDGAFDELVVDLPSPRDHRRKPSASGVHSPARDDLPQDAPLTMFICREGFA